MIVFCEYIFPLGLAPLQFKFLQFSPFFHIDEECKDAIWVLSPKGKKDLGSKSPIQWICREWVGKLGSNELGNKYSRSKWQESKDKLVLSKEKPSSAQSEEISSCVYFLNLITSTVLSATIFFSQISLLVLILVTSAHSWSLWEVYVRLKTTVQVSLPHYCGQRVSCRAFNAVVAAFP